MMRRRTFLAAFAAGPLLAQSKPFPMGLNTYSLRALNWTDEQHLRYAASLKMDALFLQDTKDPQAASPQHWTQVKAWAQELGLHLETGGGSVLPRNPAETAKVVDTLRMNIRRAGAMGSPIVRSVLSNGRPTLPPGTVDQHIETVAKIIKGLRNEIQDNNVKISFEVHKDLQAWEFRKLVDACGKDLAGIQLDTCNPLLAMEHPLTTLEELAPFCLTLSLQDAVVYTGHRGIWVYRVPVGEGTLNLRTYMNKVRELCPNIYVYSKPVTGRPPELLAIHDDEYWKMYPQARAADYARFLSLVKQGQPYDKHVVNEDLAGTPINPLFQPAVKAQQSEHMLRSIAFMQKELDCGIRWRA